MSDLLSELNLYSFNVEVTSWRHQAFPALPNTNQEKKPPMRYVKAVVKDHQFVHTV